MMSRAPTILSSIGLAAGIQLAAAGTISAQTPAAPSAGPPSAMPAARKVTNIETSYPFWSPDGRQLVFHSNRNGNSDIYISDADGQNLRRLTDHAAEDLTPAWSPDGRTIVFQSTRDGREQLYRIGVDGSDLRRVFTNSSNNGHPKWGPDGSTIIFNSNRGADSTNEEVYEMPAEGGTARQLTTYPLWDTYASISPNGQYLAFRRVIESAGTDAARRDIPRNSEVFVAMRDGSRPVNVTNSVSFDGWPAWSPNSEWITFSSNRSGDFHLFVMRRDGSGVRQLTDAPGSWTKPIWSPDGRRIVCTRTLDGNVEIFIVDVPELR